MFGSKCGRKVMRRIRLLSDCQHRRCVQRCFPLKRSLLAIEQAIEEVDSPFIVKICQTKSHLIKVSMRRIVSFVAQPTQQHAILGRGGSAATELLDIKNSGQISHNPLNMRFPAVQTKPRRIFTSLWVRHVRTVAYWNSASGRAQKGVQGRVLNRAQPVLPAS